LRLIDSCWQDVRMQMLLLMVRTECSTEVPRSSETCGWEAVHGYLADQQGVGGQDVRMQMLLLMVLAIVSIEFATNCIFSRPKYTPPHPDMKRELN